MTEQMQDAVAAAQWLIRVGGLDDGVIKDIAHEHDVDWQELKKAIWDED